MFQDHFEFQSVNASITSNKCLNAKKLSRFKFLLEQFFCNSLLVFNVDKSKQFFTGFVTNYQVNIFISILKGTLFHRKYNDIKEIEMTRDISSPCERSE